jgi:hypothetical protein
VGITIERSKVGFFGCHNSSLQCQNCRHVMGRELQNPHARRHQRDYDRELPIPS